MRHSGESIGMRLIARATPLAVLLIAACGKEAPPPQRPPPEVSVITLEPKAIPFTQVFVAQTESSRQVNIVARVSRGADLNRAAARSARLTRLEVSFA